MILWLCPWIIFNWFFYTLTSYCLTQGVFLPYFFKLYFSNFIHLVCQISTQIMIFLILFWGQTLKLITGVYFFMSLTYSGIIWTFSNYYWNNWWIFEDYEELFTLVVLLYLFLILHSFFKYEQDLILLIGYFLFWFFALKILRFPSRHLTEVSLNSCCLWPLGYYVYNTMVYLNTSTLMRRGNNWLSFNLLPLCCYSLFFVSIPPISSLNMDDFSLLWLLNFQPTVKYFIQILTSFCCLNWLCLPFLVQSNVILSFHLYPLISYFFFSWLIFIPVSSSILLKIGGVYFFIFKVKITCLFFMSLFYFLGFLLFYFIHLIWGQFELLEFYPKNWQAGFHRTMHPWLVQMSVWHYWLVFSFLISMMLYFCYVIKALSYNRPDIRVLRSTGEKRRNVWSEMLTVLLPFFWSINIISNAFAYLRVLEGSGAYVFLNAQVAGYQWGWKYIYSNLFYYKFVSAPVFYAYNLEYPRSGKMEIPIWYADTLYDIVYDGNVSKKTMKSWYMDPILLEIWAKALKANPISKYWSLWFMNINPNLWGEVYLFRFWLHQAGILERVKDREIKNAIFQPAFLIVAQGEDVNSPSKIVAPGHRYTFVKDQGRLLQASGALVLPSRVTLRLMSTSEDVTHSWAMPGLGLKMDCVPGRLFCFYLNIGRDGIYYGQCSELCGWNHYNMPAILYVLPIEHFIVWWESTFQAQVIENPIFLGRWLTYDLSIHKYK